MTDQESVQMVRDDSGDHKFGLPYDIAVSAAAQLVTGGVGAAVGVAAKAVKDKIDPPGKHKAK